MPSSVTRRGVLGLVVILVIAAGVVWGPAGWELARYRSVERYEFSDGGGSIEFRWPRDPRENATLWRRNLSSGSFHVTYGQPPMLRVVEHGGRRYYFAFPGTDGRPDLVTDGRSITVEEESTLFTERRRWFPSVRWPDPAGDPDLGPVHWGRDSR